jgi:ribonuclease HII
MPDLEIERRLGGHIAGVDEVGRGPLAGPVLAAAVSLGPYVPPELAALIDDSKKLSATARQNAFDALQFHQGVQIALGAASVAEITRLNITGASLLAMRRAVLRLPRLPDTVLVDGPLAPRLSCRVCCIVGGDARSLSIAAASIVAKVIRDRLMRKLARHFPAYGWERNAGYPTPEHRAALARIGPSPHHRPAFGSVRAVVEVSRL